MKTTCKMLLVLLLLNGICLFARAQEKHEKLVVTSRLTELKGTYPERQLYRDFLTTYMKNCPYISHFSIHEADGASDNHEVIWHYEVKNWDSITQFYDWISDHLKSGKDNGLKKAMTPYQPEYDIGGKMKVEEISKATAARG